MVIFNTLISLNKNGYHKMKNYKTLSPVVFVWSCLIISGMLPVKAEPPSVNVNSVLPRDLLLDEAIVASVQACLGNESDFAQRFNTLVTDDQTLQQQATEIDKYKDSIQTSQLNLEQEEAQLKMGADLDVLRKGLYKNHATKPLTSEQLQKENIKIEAYNKLSGEFNVMTDQYNKQVLAQKKRIAEHNALVTTLNDAVALYNAHAQAIQVPLNKVVADVGYYQHKCAAGVKN
jgi:hypothetical protein